MNAKQRRTLKRLTERAFGNHVDYYVTVHVPYEGDGIKSCEQCGNYTTGRLCRSCQEQVMIDNDPMTEDDLRYSSGKYL